MTDLRITAEVSLSSAALVSTMARVGAGHASEVLRA